jgi:hypothetical protein
MAEDLGMTDGCQDDRLHATYRAISGDDSFRTLCERGIKRQALPSSEVDDILRMQD